MTKQNIDSLVAELRLAKIAEEKARDYRVQIETKILEFMPTKDEGSESIKTDEGTVTATFKINRKVDTDALSSAWATISENAKKAFKWKADIEIKSMRALQDMDAAAYLVASQFITATPAKPSITVK